MRARSCSCVETSRRSRLMTWASAAACWTTRACSSRVRSWTRLSSSAWASRSAISARLRSVEVAGNLRKPESVLVSESRRHSAAVQRGCRHAARAIVRHLPFHHGALAEALLGDAGRLVLGCEEDGAVDCR